MNRRHLCAEVMVEKPRAQKKQNKTKKVKSREGHSCSYFHQKQTTTPVTFNQ